MARVTTEDCIDKEPNRFNLVMMASHRAKELSTGAPSTVELDNDKNTVIALREIAVGNQEISSLHERAVARFQKRSDPELGDDGAIRRLESGLRSGVEFESTYDFPDDIDIPEDLYRKLLEEEFK